MYFPIDRVAAIYTVLPIPENINGFWVRKKKNKNVISCLSQLDLAQWNSF